MKDLKIYFEYLEKLRESGITNTFGATMYLEKEFGLEHEEAKDILISWMKSHSFSE